MWICICLKLWSLYVLNSYLRYWINVAYRFWFPCIFTYTLSLSAILRLALERLRNQSLQPRMQVDIFLLHHGLESRTTCIQTFLQNVSVDSFLLWVHALNTPTAEVHWRVFTFPKNDLPFKNIPPEINYVNLDHLTHKGVSCHATLNNKLSGARGVGRGGRGWANYFQKKKVKSSCSLAWNLGHGNKNNNNNNNNNNNKNTKQSTKTKRVAR